MSMISFESSGSFQNTENFFKRMAKQDISSMLNRFGAAGVTALSANTPKNSGLTAASWGYRVKKKRKGWTVEWYNTNTIDDVEVAVLIQYGHGTGTGGYVPGYDYINPTMQPIFDAIIADIWKEVQK